MTARATAPYGSWPSPISAADVARARLRLSYPTIHGDQVWWQETRPERGGRTTIVRSGTDLLPAPWNARTRVHEYGGRAYLPLPDGDLVFANYADQRLYRLTEGQTPLPLTPEPAEPAGLRYADLTLSPDGQHLWCVQEAHAGGAVRRAIVAIPVTGAAAQDPGAIRELVSGADFYAFPTPSPGGGHLAWVQWSHPRMPWDGTELRVANFDPAGTIERPRTVKGGLSESALAPTWIDDSSLYVVSDWPGWWNLYEVGLAGGSPQALYPAEEEFAGPLWQLGGRPYAVLDDGRIAVLHGQGDQRLGLYDPETAELTDFELPYTDWKLELSADGTTIVGVAGAPDIPWSVVAVDADSGEAKVLRSEMESLPDSAYLPLPRAQELEGPFGRPVHAFVYPPSNPSAQAPEGELPPYIVFVHGGPTGHSTSVLDMEIAYFTSRGLGVIDVNYGGSTGYGRSYRERLRRQWGIVDVEDTVAAAEALVRGGVADPGRLAIRGGSAGGWTTLCAITGSTLFKAGTSYYGIADPQNWLKETHDFESRYLYGLIGPMPGFERAYEERSPVARASSTACPVLLLQGLDDPIVSPPQSERFADAVAGKNIPYAYLTFEGESHGFRRAETVIACLEAELAFYGQTLGFDPKDVAPVQLTVERRRIPPPPPPAPPAAPQPAAAPEE
ncbi:prolyl oligopeptidase family serine peptidase [Actinomadura sp. DC4]|uniref:S9 family peptidase n=1 Tax=Actinomadura sp. DC4 TaxID=3055069 RepID=UPI0025B1DBE6|nr:prolyl oligopeptidase family serine peptidase [Actinomadura sp. DC4]MDN3353531.1 prolyl oligopeptidase family serine peptidase [Actinomadura sp. DC4]